MIPNARVTGWPAMMMILVDIRHDIALRQGQFEARPFSERDR